MDTALYLITIVVCLLLSAFFSGSETALLRLGKEELDADVKKAHGPAILAARDLLGSTPRLLVTILLGNNVVNILAAATAATLAVHFLGERYGVLVATIVMTIVVFAFAEVLPKAIASRDPRRFSYKVSLPLYMIHRMLKPVHLLFDRFMGPIIQKISKGASGEGQESLSLEQILSIARRVPLDQKDGSPMPIIASTAKAAGMVAEGIMIPRAEIFALPVSTDAKEFLGRALEERYTRIPVYEEAIDKIFGIIHVKDLFKLISSGERDIRSIVKPILRVPERKPILEILEDMQRAFIHVAIVKDEFGGSVGMITQEDILEEIVGEIRDEFDFEELQIITKLPDGSYQALGRMSLNDFNRESGWNIEGEHGDTLSGLTFNKLGRPPLMNDVVKLSGYRIQVLDISGMRITRVRVSKSDR